MGRNGAALVQAARIRGAATEVLAAPQKETAVLEVLVDIPCDGQSVKDALDVVAGQFGRLDEISFEVVGKYDENYLEDRPAALRISRNVTHLIGAARPVGTDPTL